MASVTGSLSPNRSPPLVSHSPSLQRMALVTDPPFSEMCLLCSVQWPLTTPCCRPLLSLRWNNAITSPDPSLHLGVSTFKSYNSVGLPANIKSCSLSTGLKKLATSVWPYSTFLACVSLLTSALCSVKRITDISVLFHLPVYELCVPSGYACPF